MVLVGLWITSLATGHPQRLIYSTSYTAACHQIFSTNITFLCRNTTNPLRKRFQHLGTEVCSLPWQNCKGNCGRGDRTQCSCVVPFFHLCYRTEIMSQMSGNLRRKKRLCTSVKNIRILWRNSCPYSRRNVSCKVFLTLSVLLYFYFFNTLHTVVLWWLPLLICPSNTTIC